MPTTKKRGPGRPRTTGRAAADRQVCAVSLSSDELAQLRDDALRAGLSSAPELLRHLWQSWRAGEWRPDREGLRTSTARLRALAQVLDDAAADLQDEIGATEHAADLITETGARVDDPPR